MSFWKRINIDLFWISLLALVSMLIQLLAYKPLGFHRDEFLYLALGRHLDTGYWSNPPLMGLISALSQQLPGNSIFTTRFFPALSGAFLVILTGLITKELGGKRFAQLFACLGLISSILFLRTSSMLMPVPFDILFWTISLYFLLKYVNTKRSKFILIIGITIGIGLLNKYNIGFLAVAILLAIPFTNYRVLYKNSFSWLAIFIAVMLLLPNLLWQFQHHFPVIGHLNELVRTQLVNVNRINIITDQFFLLTGSSILWFPGLFWLLRSAKVKEFRIFGLIYLIVLGIFIILRGKSYYTAGLYPFLVAAGGVYWENALKRNYSKLFTLGIVLLINFSIVPIGIPVFNTKGLISFFRGIHQKTGVEVATRWEDGRIHPLPQDYADMLGWDELAKLVIKACDTMKDKSQIMLYGENYGEAGSIEHYTRSLGYGPACSFSDSYLLWAPDSISKKKTVFIYINSEMGQDVRNLFAQIDSLGSITNKYAREFGTSVYMCRRARNSFPEFWARRVKQVKAARFH